MRCHPERSEGSGPDTETAPYSSRNSATASLRGQILRRFAPQNDILRDAVGPGGVKYIALLVIRAIYMTPPTTSSGNARFICTAATPWDGRDKWVQHPDAVPEGDQYDGYPGGDIQAYRCQHCHHRFEIELPQ